jgi:hypothetical protein
MSARQAACHCGQLRLEVTGDPLVVFICHCLDCRRRTGSAFGMQSAFGPDQVENVGRYSAYSLISDEAGEKEHVFHFCSEFGSQNPLYESDKYAAAADRARGLLDAHREYRDLAHNVACCVSRAGRADDVIEHLSLAIDCGEQVRGKSARDPDFDPIRGERAFRELVG